MSKIQDAFNKSGRLLFESEKPVVDAFNIKYASEKTTSQPGVFINERHTAIINELASHLNIPVTDALFSFYTAVYSTAVYDMADSPKLKNMRDELLAEFCFWSE